MDALYCIITSDKSLPPLFISNPFQGAPLRLKSEVASNTRTEFWVSCCLVTQFVLQTCMASIVNECNTWPFWTNILTHGHPCCPKPSQCWWWILMPHRSKQSGRFGTSRHTATRNPAGYADRQSSVSIHCFHTPCASRMNSPSTMTASSRRLLTKVIVAHSSIAHKSGRESVTLLEHLPPWDGVPRVNWIICWATSGLGT